MQDSILILVAQEGGAASASERKTRRESTQKARVVTSGRQAGRQASSPAQGGKGLASRKGLGLTCLCKGAAGLRFAREHTYSIAQPGAWKDPQKPPSHGVRCSVPSPTLCTSVCSFQAAGTGQRDICLWEGDLVPVSRKAAFALTESIGWCGCDGERYLAQLAVNSAAAFSAHSYCQDSNYSCTYFPIDLI